MHHGPDHDGQSKVTLGRTAQLLREPVPPPKKYRILLAVRAFWAREPWPEFVLVREEQLVLPRPAQRKIKVRIDRRFHARRRRDRFIKIVAYAQQHGAHNLAAVLESPVDGGRVGACCPRQDAQAEALVAAFPQFPGCIEDAPLDVRIGTPGHGGYFPLRTGSSEN